jgi:hypothetical protein
MDDIISCEKFSSVRKWERKSLSPSEIQSLASKTESSNLLTAILASKGCKERHLSVGPLK